MVTSANQPTKIPQLAPAPESAPTTQKAGVNRVAAITSNINGIAGAINGLAQATGAVINVTNAGQGGARGSAVQEVLQNNERAYAHYQTLLQDVITSMNQSDAMMVDMVQSGGAAIAATTLAQLRQEHDKDNFDEGLTPLSGGPIRRRDFA